jgi:hypothetical protein
MPFASKEIARLYLRCAEVIAREPCGIYELTYKRGDKRYRIFRSTEELLSFLKTNKEISSNNPLPVYINKKIKPARSGQIRYLSSEEINRYLTERAALGISDEGGSGAS